jgi:hypothetical protein
MWFVFNNFFYVCVYINIYIYIYIYIFFFLQEQEKVKWSELSGRTLKVSRQFKKVCYIMVIIIVPLMKEVLNSWNARKPFSQMYMLRQTTRGVFIKSTISAPKFHSLTEFVLRYVEQTPAWVSWSVSLRQVLGPETSNCTECGEKKNTF